MRNRVAALALVAALLTACNGGTPKAGPSPGATRKPSPSPTPEICPLTGRLAPAGFESSRPVLGVKIENSIKSRPQAGLENADIVYEELAEGGITRFLAIFHCDDAGPLGPIRSARMVDPEILLEYKPALFAFSGANPLVSDKVEDTEGITPIRHRDHGDAFRRERGRSAPSNLFSTTQILRELDDAKDVRGAPKTGFVFAAGAGTPATPSPTPARKSPARSATPPPPASAPPQAANTIRFDYSGNNNVVKYTYDPASATYLRFHGETPHNSVKGEQFRSVNIVILKVKVTQGTIRDARGNFSPEITVLGEGEASVIRNGFVTHGKWKRAELTDRTQLVDASGASIALAPGNTWIHLVPSDRAAAVIQ